MVLLNDILDLSKVEAGRLELKQAVFDPAQLLDEVRHLFAGMAQGQKLKLKADWQNPDAVRYRGDPVRRARCCPTSSAMQSSSRSPAK